MTLKIISTPTHAPVAAPVPDKKALDAARQFEAFFIAQILKSAVPEGDEESFLSNGNVRQFEAMRNDFLATEMSKSGSFSLAADLATRLARRP
jgi:Rod binding domain-containing protein